MTKKWQFDAEHALSSYLAFMDDKSDFLEQPRAATIYYFLA